MTGSRPARRQGSIRLVATLIAVLAATVLAAPVSADPNNNNSRKLRSAVTLEGVRAHQAALQAIADLNGDTRFAGLPGFDASAAYVADQLRAVGYDVTIQEFVYDAFFESSTAQLQRIAPTPATYVNGNDFRTMTFSGSGAVTAAVTPVDYAGADSGCQASDFAGFPAGNIALMRRGTCSFRIKTANAAAAGASAALIGNNTSGLLNGTLGAGGLSTIPSLGLTQALGAQLSTTAGLVMRVSTDTGASPLTTRNVLAETADGDPNNVVMAGAHLDSVGQGPGINDNGSGSAAILETAIQMAKVKPRNKVRFAWWSAEESGLIGSTRYVASLSEAERDRIALYLNFDMVGSPNFVRFVYDGDNSTFPVGTGIAAGPPGSGTIEAQFASYFASQGLASAPTPFNGRSDYGPFIAQGIPAGGLFTGAEGIKTAEQAAIYGGTAGTAYDPCYHAACDTYANFSPVALDQMSDAIANAVITYAQSTESINGIRGKGNFKRSPQPLPAGGGGTNGGLHGDEDLFD